MYFKICVYSMPSSIIKLLFPTPSKRHLHKSRCLCICVGSLLCILRDYCVNGLKLKGKLPDIDYDIEYSFVVVCHAL